MDCDGNTLRATGCRRLECARTYFTYTVTNTGTKPTYLDDGPILSFCIKEVVGPARLELATKGL